MQSTLMNSLFKDLDTEQAKADLATLGLEDWLIQLKKLQDRFSKLFQQRNEIEAEKEIPTKSEAKAELVKNLSTLLKGLEFLAKIKPGIYGETNKLINEIAGRIASSYR